MSVSRTMPPLAWSEGRMKTPHACIICRRAFYPKPSSKRFYCSPECAALHRRRMAEVARRIKERRKAQPLTATERKALGL